MRELSHSDPTAFLPPPKMLEHELREVSTLPWQRRERADANIRRAIGDLRALALEDTPWSQQYHAMAEAFESAVRLLDAIEDADA